MRIWWIVLVFLAGIAGGWLLRDAMPGPATVEMIRDPVPARPAEFTPRDLESRARAGHIAEVVEDLEGDTTRLAGLMKRLPADLALALARQFTRTYGESFAVVLAEAGLQSGLKDFPAAIETLLGAALLANDAGQQEALDRTLEQVTDAYARELIAAEDFHSVDRMYQRITLALPEQAEYYMKLGMLRMRMGDFEQALTPLSHIENHGKWGERARELMRQAEASEVRDAPGQERLALQSAGSQFVVEAIIDHGGPVRLLIDTGAAMTIIDESLLRGLGYSLANRQEEYFATAGGVVKAPVVTIGHLGLGNAGISELSVGALPLGMHGDINGLLGMNFLRHYEFRIDQAGKVLYLQSRR